MPIDWKSSENNERLLACLFAALDEAKSRIDYKRIAELFGQNTTANAIECNFRKIRAASKKIREEVTNGGAPSSASSVPSTPRKPKTPKKDALSGVKSGRVEKPVTPSRKQRTPVVKTEEVLTPPSEEGFASTMEFQDIDVNGEIMYEDNEY